MQATDSELGVIEQIFSAASENQALLTELRNAVAEAVFHDQVAPLQTIGARTLDAMRQMRAMQAKALDEIEVPPHG